MWNQTENLGGGLQDAYSPESRLHKQGNNTEGKASCNMHQIPSTKHLYPGQLNPTPCDFKQVSNPTWVSEPQPVQ